MYNNEVECFIPGSHAAANVVYNFNDMLGKTLFVMVDNYDQSNDLFILSHKKYITSSMPIMIENLHFNIPYSGILTSKPYDFGIFVEIFFSIKNNPFLSVETHRLPSSSNSASDGL